MLTIDLLRHGELEGGIKYRGIVDDPLTDGGRRAMDEVWAKLEPYTTMIISSPLSRCAEPAQFWAEQSNIICHLDQRIQELHYGDWEDLTVAEIKQHSPEMLRKWRDNPEHMTPPNGESMSAFSDRIQSFLHDIISTYQDEHILLVAHSGTIRMLIALALQAPIVSTRHLDMPYACWSRLQVLEDGKLVLSFHAK